MKACIVCGKGFSPKNRKGVYCSAACRQRDYRVKRAAEYAEYKRWKAGGVVGDEDTGVDRFKARGGAVSGGVGGKSREEIMAEIRAIRAERIPPERDTPLGRRVWKYEQDKRVAELEGLLNS